MTHEQQPPPELNHEIIGYYIRTFISRYDRYPLQRNNGKYVAIDRLLLPNVVEKHLLGKHTIGAYVLDSQSRAKWICLDADDDQEWLGLKTLAADLCEDHIPSYLETSRRGGHLWLFLHKSLSGQDARRFGKQLLGGRSLETVELYPKQDALRTGPGSLVRLPLGVHRLTGKRYHFITPDGRPLAPTIREQIRLLTHPQRVPEGFVAQVLKDAPEPKVTFPTPRFVSRANRIVGDTPSERIKNRISVLDFVSQYVQLDRGNRGLCPFHDDHIESFSVNDEGNYWNCFANCGGGSVIDFWMKWRALHGQEDSFNTTISELATMLL